MGQLRTTTTALTHLGCPPEEILRQLSDTVAAHGDEAGATCLHAEYDPVSRRCRLTSAGHPPPVIRHPDGSTEFIDLPSGLLLGADPDCSYLTVDRQLASGAIPAMYTDGLIERPGEDLATGMTRLARALPDGPAQSLDELCDSVLASLAGQGWMFSRSSRRLGCFGFQPSACRVRVLDEGWSVAKTGPRVP
jgi:serine phosphatase RsbU (regulator of sigma subunit)